MPFTKKAGTTSKKIDKTTTKKAVPPDGTTVPKKTEKPPRGYEYRTFLVKKEAKVAKVGRTQDTARVQKERLFGKER